MEYVKKDTNMNNPKNWR